MLSVRGVLSCCPNHVPADPKGVVYNIARLSVAVSCRHVPWLHMLPVAPARVRMMCALCRCTSGRAKCTTTVPTPPPVFALGWAHATGLISVGEFQSAWQLIRMCVRESDRHQLEAQSLRKVLCSVLEEAVGFGF